MKIRVISAPFQATKGISLIEILIAISILAILGTLIAVLINRILIFTQSATCAGNLRQVGAAFLLYAADNGGNLPQRAGTEDNPQGTGIQWPWQIHPYLGIDWADTYTHTPLYCPTSQHFDPENPGFSRSYRYNRHISQARVNAVGEPLPPSAWQAEGNLMTIAHPAKLLMLIDASHASQQGLSGIREGGRSSGIDLRESNANHIDFIRHGGRANVLFADSHVEGVKPDENGLPNGVSWRNGQ